MARWLPLERPGAGGGVRHTNEALPGGESSVQGSTASQTPITTTGGVSKGSAWHLGEYKSSCTSLALTLCQALFEVLYKYQLINLLKQLQEMGVAIIPIYRRETKVQRR